MAMQLSLQVFEYHGDNKVRTAEIDGQIWFYAVDVCKILELNNVSQALSALDDDEKTTIINSDGQAGIGAQSFLVINEPGLYSLIIRSRKPEAKAFKRWVTHEVLPSIRKKGGYLLPGMSATPNFIRRYNANWDRVDKGYFSVISELTIRLYGRLEQLGHRMADIGPDGKELRPDVSVGRMFSDWLKKHMPEASKDSKYYSHVLPDGNTVDAKQYPLDLWPVFIRYVDDVWMHERAHGYFQERDPLALPYLPKMLPGS
jgi:prophage antirepressor-like protein